MKAIICATVLSAWCRDDRGDSPCYSSSQDSSASHRGIHQCRCRTHTGSRCRPIPLHTGGRIYSQITSELAFTVSTKKEQLKSSKAVIKNFTPDTRLCRPGGRCIRRWGGKGWAGRSHRPSPAYSPAAGPQHSRSYRVHT